MKSATPILALFFLALVASDDVTGQESMVSSQLAPNASGSISNAIQLCSGCCGLTDCDPASISACDGLSCCDSYPPAHQCPQCSRHSLSRLESICDRLADHGLTAKGEFVQFYQGVTSGGEERRFRYGDKLNVYLELDTGKLGLWEGGKLESHAVDWQFGKNSISDAVAFAPVNTSLLTPETDSPSFGTTSLVYTQMLEGGYAAQVGRMNLIDLWTGFYPDYGRGNDGFMNLSTVIPLSIIPSQPLITNGAGLVKAGEKGIEAAFYVFESENSPTTVGLDFPNGVTLLAAATKFTNFGCQPGRHSLYGIYATGDYTSFEERGWIILPDGVVIPPEQKGTWAAAYVGEQQLWVDRCNPQRRINLRGYVGFSDRETSPFATTSAVTIESFGPLSGRPGDRMGIGYFYNQLNDDFQEIVSLVTPIDDVHGGEVYYNAEVTPTLHVTADLQAINPEIQNQDTAVVLGLRATIGF